MVQGAQQGVRVAVMRLPIYVYEDSVWCSFMADIQVQAAKKAGAASYINSGAASTVLLYNLGGLGGDQTRAKPGMTIMGSDHWLVL